MPAFFLELFSEEIPARMQARAAEDLSRLLCEALAALAPNDVRTFHAPRRIAFAAEVGTGVAASRTIERGPRRTAPEQALAGFLRKHAASREQLREEGEFWVLDRASPGVDAKTLIAGALPGLLRRFPWPKSMRWGGTSTFTWVRPLRRIVCLLDGAVVPFDLRDGADDGHELAASDLSEGHRFLSPGPFRVTGADGWIAELRARHVIVDPAERRHLVTEGVAAVAAAQGLSVVDDPGLADEVAGLVEWPVALLGRIDPAYMDLPAEVMQVSMRVNQRYFALRDATGSAAPYFAFVANIEAEDGGRTIVAGNERVLRARFSDARHFWDLDRKQTLASRVPTLDGVTFHAKLGSQGDRVRRLVALARRIAPMVGADPEQAGRAALLAKADLTTGMVAEFPELQGVIGSYYASNDGESPEVADAARFHYAPRGPSDEVPEAPVTRAVSLADKIDSLVGFFGIDQKPTGSGDPFALRRAAYGIIRVAIQSPKLRITDPISASASDYGYTDPHLVDDIFTFLIERVRVMLRSDGQRSDIFTATFRRHPDLNLNRGYRRFYAVAAALTTPTGNDLLVVAKRACNILKIEERADGRFNPNPDPKLFGLPQEAELSRELDDVEAGIMVDLSNEDFSPAMTKLARLLDPLSAFFDKVTVNDPRPDVRRNRLCLLARVRASTDLIADFSVIEG